MHYNNSIDVLFNSTVHALTEVFKEVTDKPTHTTNDITVEAMFPQVWSSTALGFGGIGGQAITTAYVCVLRSDYTGACAVYFNGKFAYLIERPNAIFWEDVRNCCMCNVSQGKKKYEGVV